MSLRLLARTTTRALHALHAQTRSIAATSARLPTTRAPHAVARDAWSRRRPWQTDSASLQQSAAFATNRQKIKTPSCLKRRFRMTGTGQYIRYGAKHSHNLSKQSKRQRSHRKRRHLVPKSFARILKRLNFKRR